MLIRFCMNCRKAIKPKEVSGHTQGIRHRICDICGHCPDCDEEGGEQ